MSMGDMGIYCQSPTFKTKSVGKIRKCENLLFIAFFAKKDKITKFQNVLDQPILVLFFLLHINRTPFESSFIICLIKN